MERRVLVVGLDASGAQRRRRAKLGERSEAPEAPMLNPQGSKRVTSQVLPTASQHDTDARRVRHRKNADRSSVTPPAV
jgi:hypothetical protein